jgi:hypothetical protein
MCGFHRIRTSDFSKSTPQKAVISTGGGAFAAAAERPPYFAFAFGCSLFGSPKIVILSEGGAFAAESNDLRLLLPLPVLPTTHKSPVFTHQSRTPKLFFTLLLSKIACQAPKLTKIPITQAPSTR